MNEPRSHDEMLDLVAVYALGAVGADEARFISAHLATCEDCRREYEVLRPAADAVALSTDDKLDAKDSAPMKSRLMDAVRATLPAQVARRHRARPAMWVAGFALAAALVMGFFTWNAERRVNDLQLASAQVYRVAAGEVYRTPQRVYLVMRSLPSLPANRVYQAWTLAPGAKTVAPSLTFVPDEHGFVVVSLPVPASDVSAVAVSVEPAGGSKAPTTKPLFVQPLT